MESRLDAFVRDLRDAARSAQSVQGAPPTCDARALDADSYALTTRGIAEVVLEERALRLDERNLLAHATLAGQYVIGGEDAEYADKAWRTVLDHGGAVVWTATLYDVDAKSYFVLAFDRAALRIYRYGELAGPFDKKLGMPKFVGADRERFWRAWAAA